MKNIPAEIQSLLHAPSTKAAWVSDFPKLPGRCENCGGTGIIAAFVATEGPYDQPAHPYLVKDGVKLTSKSDEINGQVKYWVGRTISVPCPDCQNTLAPGGITPQHTYNPVGKMRQLADKFDVRDRADIE